MSKIFGRPIIRNSGGERTELRAYRGDVGRPLLAPVWCWWPINGGTGKCRRPAGQDTEHPGYGPCAGHEPWKMKQAWRHAMVMADELDVSPWEALTMSVRIAAARVRWVDEELRAATRRHDGEPTDREVLDLLKESRNERKILAATAKMAIDAGVAERLVRQVELEGKVLADTLDVALRAVGANEDMRVLALEAAHHHLTATVGDGDGVWAVPGQFSGPPEGDAVRDDRSDEPGPESAT